MEKENSQNTNIVYICPMLELPKHIAINLNEYEKSKESIERHLGEVFGNYGISHSFIGGKPFFITGREQESQDTFVVGQSEFYSMFQILESLLISTREKYETNFHTLVKGEHLPRNQCEHPSPNIEKETYTVVFPIAIVFGDENIPVNKTNFNLKISEELDIAFNNLFTEIFDYEVDCKSIAMTPYNTLAQEAILKVIQASGVVNKGIARIPLSPSMSMSNEKNRISQPINTLYVDGKTVFIPCHTYEDITSILASMEHQLGIPPLEAKNENMYIQIWLQNQISIVMIKRTLESLGFNCLLARSDFKYSVEGDITRIYQEKEKDFSIEKELEENRNLSYNVIKFITGDVTRDFIKENCKEIMFYVQKAKNLSPYKALGEELMTSAIFVSYLSKKGMIIASENFYGDIGDEVEAKIIEYISNKANESNLSIKPVNDVVNVNYDNIFNTLIATKPTEE